MRRRLHLYRNLYTLGQHNSIYGEPRRLEPAAPAWESFRAAFGNLGHLGAQAFAINERFNLRFQVDFSTSSTEPTSEHQPWLHCGREALVRLQHRRSGSQHTIRVKTQLLKLKARRHRRQGNCGDASIAVSINGKVDAPASLLTVYHLREANRLNRSVSPRLHISNRFVSLPGAAGCRAGVGGASR